MNSLGNPADVGMDSTLTALPPVLLCIIRMEYTWLLQNFQNNLMNLDNLIHTFSHTPLTDIFRSGPSGLRFFFFSKNDFFIVFIWFTLYEIIWNHHLVKYLFSSGIRFNFQSRLLNYLLKVRANLQLRLTDFGRNCILYWIKGIGYDCLASEQCPKSGAPSIGCFHICLVWSVCFGTCPVFSLSLVRLGICKHGNHAQIHNKIISSRLSEKGGLGPIA